MSPSSNAPKQLRSKADDYSNMEDRKKKFLAQLVIVGGIIFILVIIVYSVVKVSSYKEDLKKTLEKKQRDNIEKEEKRAATRKLDLEEKRLQDRVAQRRENERQRAYEVTRKRYESDNKIAKAALLKVAAEKAAKERLLAEDQATILTKHKQEITKAVPRGIKVEDSYKAPVVPLELIDGKGEWMLKSGSTTSIKLLCLRRGEVNVSFYDSKYDLEVSGIRSSIAEDDGNVIIRCSHTRRGFSRRGRDVGILGAPLPKSMFSLEGILFEIKKGKVTRVLVTNNINHPKWYKATVVTSPIPSSQRTMKAQRIGVKRQSFVVKMDGKRNTYTWENGSFVKGLVLCKFGGSTPAAFRKSEIKSISFPYEGAKLDYPISVGRLFGDAPNGYRFVTCPYPPGYKK